MSPCVADTLHTISHYACECVIYGFALFGMCCFINWLAKKIPGEGA